MTSGLCQVDMHCTSQEASEDRRHEELIREADLRVEGLLGS